MTKYPFSTIDNRNFATDARHEFAAVDSTARTNGKADAQNFITEGGLILNDFFVAPPRNRVYSFVVAPRNRRKNQGLQLGKEGILSSL